MHKDAIESTVHRPVVAGVGVEGSPPDRRDPSRAKRRQFQIPSAWTRPCSKHVQKIRKPTLRGGRSTSLKTIFHSAMPASSQPSRDRQATRRRSPIPNRRFSLAQRRVVMPHSQPRPPRKHACDGPFLTDVVHLPPMTVSAPNEPNKLPLR